VVQSVYALLNHQAMHYGSGKVREHSRKADWMFVKFMTLTRRKRHNRFPPDYHAIPRVALQPFHGYDDSRGCLVRGSICFALRISWMTCETRIYRCFFPSRPVPTMSRMCPILTLIVNSTWIRNRARSLRAPLFICKSRRFFTTMLSDNSHPERWRVLFDDISPRLEWKA